VFFFKFSKNFKSGHNYILLFKINGKYIVYLYRSEKKGEKDYEKLGRIAIDDEIDSTPVNTSDPVSDEKKERKK